jgi:hypothetical protein
MDFLPALDRSLLADFDLLPPALLVILVIHMAFSEAPSH